jgi:hypothetical protein
MKTRKTELQIDENLITNYTPKYTKKANWENYYPEDL